MTPPPAITQAGVATPLGLGEGHVAGASLLSRLILPRTWIRLRALIDVVVLCCAASIALLGAHEPVSASSRLTGLLFPLVVFAILQFQEDRERRLSASVLDSGIQVLAVVSVASMLAIVLGTILGGAHAVALALRLWVFGVVYLGVTRMVLLSVRQQLMRSRALATPTVVVGAGIVGERVVRHLLTEARYGLRPVGFVDSSPLGSTSHSPATSVPVLGGLDGLEQVLQSTGARRVILAFSAEPDRVLVEKVRVCAQQGVEVSLVPRLYESINERSTLDHLGGLPLLSLRPTNPHGWQFAVKHALGRGLALLTLLALAPLMLALALAVRMSSPGPVLFRQQRVGRDGHTFDLLKLRTMRELETPPGFQPESGHAPGGVEGVDRRTPIGTWLRRTSLDELPQFFNVLRGDMTIVGPRPERPEYVALFTQDVERYEDRHRVKSGITGWAQVKGLRGQTSIADRVEWDNYYIQNWSLRLDLRIIAMTVTEVLRLRG